MKLCKSDCCTNYVFSHGYCRRHQGERTDEKWLKKLNTAVTGRKPIQKVSKRRAKKIIDRKQLDEIFYESIWSCNPHVCENCVQNLGNEPGTFNFHHILEKAKYPLFRYNTENIMLLCWDCHQEAHANNKPSWYRLIQQERKAYFGVD